MRFNCLERNTETAETEKKQEKYLRGECETAILRQQNTTKLLRDDLND